MKLAVGQPGDGGLQFAPDGKRILFLSGREGGQQVWLADFDPATGAASNARKLTAIATEADNAKWSPDGKSIVFTSAVYPDCPAITTADFATGNACNADRDKALAASKVKAQIWTHLLYRHWDHYTGDKRSHLFLVSVETGAMREPDAERCTQRSARLSLGGTRLRMRLLARLEGTGVYGELRSRAGDLDQCRHLHARSDRSRGEAGKSEHVGRRQLLAGVLAGR